MSAIELEREQAAADAQATFDLGDFLSGRSFNTETISVYTDEVTARLLGGEFAVGNGFGPAKTERRGVWGEVLALRDLREVTESQRADGLEDELLVGGFTDEDAKRLAELEARAAELRETLEASALQIKLRSIPEDVKKAATRKAKEAVGFTGKGRVPEADREEFDEKENQFVIARSIVSITRPDGIERTRFSAEDVEILAGKLPFGEFPKITAAVVALSYRAQVAEQATLGDPDFSQAGS